MFLSLIAAKVRIARPPPLELPVFSNDRSDDKCPIRIDNPKMTWEMLKSYYPSVTREDLEKENPGKFKSDTSFTTLAGLMPFNVPIPCPQQYTSQKFLQSNPRYARTTLASNGSLVLSLCFAADYSEERCIDKNKELIKYKHLDEYGLPKNTDKKRYMKDLAYFFWLKVTNGVSRGDSDYQYTICRAKDDPYHYNVYESVGRGYEEVLNPSLVNTDNFNQCYGVNLE